MTLRLGDVAPDFEQDSSIGRIKFYEWGQNAHHLRGVHVSGTPN